MPKSRIIALGGLMALLAGPCLAQSGNGGTALAAAQLRVTNTLEAVKQQELKAEDYALIGTGAVLGAVALPVVYPMTALVVGASGAAVGTVAVAALDVAAATGAAVAAIGHAAGQVVTFGGSTVSATANAAHTVIAGSGVMGQAVLGAAAGGAAAWWYGEQRQD